MRAALGLPDDINMYTAQLRQQREAQLRQLLLQEHIDQQLQQESHLQSDYQLQQYRNMLNEQLQREDYLRQAEVAQQYQEGLFRQQFLQNMGLDPQLSPTLTASVSGGLPPGSPPAKPAAVPPQVMLPTDLPNGSDHAAMSAAAATKPAAKRPRAKSTDEAGKKKAKKQPRAKSSSAMTVERLADVALAAEMVVVPLGSVEELLQAAETSDHIENAASVLESFRQSTESYEGEEMISAEEEEILARLPQLPREPTLFAEDERGVASGSSATAPSEYSMAEQPRKVTAVLDYPLPVDTWWPSVSGVDREKEANDDLSVEADYTELEFEDSTARFRANTARIRQQLATNVEPGVLEKLCHCRVHRVRTKQKKNSTAPELLFCWQVTEAYPNEIMVCCSLCGTWRHAACGGHYKPYSIRENLKEPFEAVCENCHAERKFLEEYPQGAKRLQRQRLEHIRRGLATTAVMRHASYSKHSGTYKWPIGSVSVSHIGGHTRSVHARHDKATKQWLDMSNRLSRGHGYRSKDRIRTRTKELERLLVHIEDAEAHTDRHNMYLFLRRDTQREQPVGYEKERQSLFDAEDTVEGEACARQGCDKARRFDSIFCSDGCGVAMSEASLLKVLQDAAEMHPSFLRL